MPPVSTEIWERIRVLGLDCGLDGTNELLHVSLTIRDTDQRHALTKLSKGLLYLVSVGSWAYFEVSVVIALRVRLHHDGRGSRRAAAGVLS